MIQKLKRLTTRMLATLFAVFATSGAWADDASLVSYLSFDTIGANGVNLQCDGGSVDAVNVENGYLNYTTTANAKFGDHAYQSNGGAIGWKNTTGGLVSVADGFTISFWFHPNATGNYRSFFGFGFLNGKNYRFDKSGDSLVVYESAASGDTETTGTQLALIPYTGSAWNHVAIVCQPGGSSLTVYVNATPSSISPSGISSTSLSEVRFCYGRCIDGQDGAIYRSPYGTQSTWFDDAALFSGVLYGSSIWKIAAGTQPMSALMEDSAFLAVPVNKPSININFTSGTALSTGADVGIGDYAVPGTSWNNLIGNNGSLATIKGVDSTGEASTISGAKVTISGTRGYWSNSSVQAASDLRQGYIDDNAGNASPQFVVEGIPYDRYKVILYFSNNDANVKFGYVTVNGINYKGDLDNTTTVTSSGGSETWGASSVSAYTEGGNYLVIPTQLNGDGTLTVVSHRLTGCRAGLAAVQIVEDEPDMSGENNLEIPVSGDTTYTVGEGKTLTGTVYLTGSGTLTLDGSAKITAATIDVGKNVVLNINADRLDATTFTGLGTVVYDGSQPVPGKGWTDSGNWIGTVWVKNVGSSGSLAALGHTDDSTNTNPVNGWGNANSFVKFTNVYGYMSGANCPWTLILEDDGDNKAWYNNNGWSGRKITIGGLKGSGTFYDAGNKKCRQNLVFTDATAFTGSIHVEGKRIGLGGTPTVSGDSETLAGVIEVVTGATATLASGKTWYAGYRIAVNGTLTDNGTMDSGNTSAAISGSGTVVFDGKTPSPTGNAWWKNAAWTGTVEVKNHTLPDNWLLSDYGNTGSKVRLDGVSGPIKYGTDSTTHNIKELIIASGGYTHTGTYSSGTVSFTVPCKITGSGTYKMQSGGAAQKTTYFTGDMSEFGGTLAFGDDYSRFVIGSTETPFTAKSIVVGDGAVAKISYPSQWYPAGGVVIEGDGVLDVASGEGYIETSAGIVVNGTVKAKSLRTIWGGISANTPITINSTGVLELTSSENTNDSSFGTGPTNLDLSNVTGTGTIKYSSTAGWRAFPDQDARMPASTVGIQVELADSLIISKNNGETVIGSLSGSKNIRSDFGDNGENGRILTVTQSKDTEWQGKFVSNRLTKFNVVAPAEGTPGTLTLSGTQTLADVGNPISLNVSGAVNLTGTWVGATTVAGTFGGTGTLTGDLTFNAGSTFKAFASGANGLSVSGTVTYPAEGTVTVDVDALGSPESDVVLISKSGLDGNKFALKSGTPANYTLKVEDNALKLKVLVSITVPAVENTTVTVTVGGDTIGTAAGSYYVLPGAEVTVTYAAVSGYELSGTATYTIASATEDTTITITDTVAKLYVAQNGSAKFTTLAAAIANVATTSNPMVTLLANISEPEVTVSSTVMIMVMGGYTINADIKIADGGVLQSMATLNGKLTIEDGGAYATTGGTLSELVTEDGATIELGMLSETTAPLSVTKLSVEGALTVRSSYGAGTFGTTYKAISYVTANATIAQDAEFVGINQWESSVASEGANTIVSLTFTKIAVVDGVYYADAQDAVDAAVASGQPVSFLGAPGTVKIGIGETLIVSAGTQPTVALEDGLMNPPYDIAQTIDESYRNIYTVERYVAKLRNPNVGTASYADEVKYTSLAAAVADVVEQTMAIYADYVAIVTLLDDVTLDEAVTVGKKMKLDLNGKTLTASGINAINNSTKLGIQGSSGSIAVTSGDSIVLTDAAATLTVSGGVTISPEPTVSDTTNYRAKKVTEAGTTTYTVVDKVGTIFSVY